MHPAAFPGTGIHAEFCDGGNGKPAAPAIVAVEYGRNGACS